MRALTTESLAHDIVSTVRTLLANPAESPPGAPCPSHLSLLCRLTEICAPASSHSDNATTIASHAAFIAAVPASSQAFCVQTLMTHALQFATRGQATETQRLVSHVVSLAPETPFVQSVLGLARYHQFAFREAIEHFNHDATTPHWPPEYAIPYGFLTFDLRNNTGAAAIVESIRASNAPLNFLQKLQIYFLTALLDAHGTCRTDDVQTLLRQDPPPAPTAFVPLALHPYATVFSRRTESAPMDPTDKHTADLIATAMLSEHDIAPYQHDHFLALLKACVTAGRYAEAQHACQHYRNRNFSCADARTYLSLFLWIRGEETLARECFHLAKPEHPRDPGVWFARAVTSAVTGDLAVASQSLQALYAAAPSFFLNTMAPTLWSMLTLVLTALGQLEAAQATRNLASRSDPLNAYRAHLYDRLKPASPPHPIPAFAMPAAFLTTAARDNLDPHPIPGRNTSIHTHNGDARP